MTKLIINGSQGRMGQALLACVARQPEWQVVAQIDAGDDWRAMIALRWGAPTSVDRNVAKPGCD